MHIGSTQDHTRMDAGLSLLSVGCFPNQSALLHCGPSMKNSRKQPRHRISLQELADMVDDLIRRLSNLLRTKFLSAAKALVQVIIHIIQPDIRL